MSACKGITKAGKLCMNPIKKTAYLNGENFCCETHKDNFDRIFVPIEIKELSCAALVGITNVALCIPPKELRKHIYKLCFCNHACLSKNNTTLICCKCTGKNNICYQCKKY